MRACMCWVLAGHLLRDHWGQTQRLVQHPLSCCRLSAHPPSQGPSLSRNSGRFTIPLRVMCGGGVVATWLLPDNRCRALCLCSGHGQKRRSIQTARCEETGHHWQSMACTPLHAPSPRGCLELKTCVDHCGLPPFVFVLQVHLRGRALIATRAGPSGSVNPQARAPFGALKRDLALKVPIQGPEVRKKVGQNQHWWIQGKTGEAKDPPG